MTEVESKYKNIKIMMGQLIEKNTRLKIENRELKAGIKRKDVAMTRAIDNELFLKNRIILIYGVKALNDIYNCIDYPGSFNSEKFLEKNLKPSFISGGVVEGETLEQFSKRFNYIPGEIALSSTQFIRILIDIGLSERDIEKELKIFDEKPGVENDL